MTRVRDSIAARRRMAGLSLIEMMIALVMALVVAAGIISVFTSTSSSNKVQAQMAALQEEGRFAIHSLRADLANANGGYCNNTGGNAGVPTGGSLYLDWLRTPIIYSQDNTAIANAFHDVTTPMVPLGVPFMLPSYMYMRGYDCTTSACKPDDPNTTVADIPPMGSAVGKRVRGTSILTLRYLKPGSGWAIMKESDPSASYISTTGGFTITLRPQANEAPASDFHDGDLAMLADCSTAQVFSVSNSSGTLTANNNFPDANAPADLSKGAAPRLFDFSRDFQTVTYFLRVACVNGTTPCSGPTTGELVRRVNGDSQPLVRGVERLDFRYGLIDANGNTRFLTADEVDSGVDGNGNAIQCPQGGGTPGPMIDAMPMNGCLWRAIQTIEVHILMDGQTPMYTLTPAEMNYIYTPDSTSMQAPSAHDVRPKQDQGFPDQLIRREFTTVVALRNFNP